MQKEGCNSPDLKLKARIGLGFNCEHCRFCLWRRCKFAKVQTFCKNLNELTILAFYNIWWGDNYSRLFVKPLKISATNVWNLTTKGILTLNWVTTDNHWTVKAHSAEMIPTIILTIKIIISLFITSCSSSSSPSTPWSSSSWSSSSSSSSSPFPEQLSDSLLYQFSVLFSKTTFSSSFHIIFPGPTKNFCSLVLHDDLKWVA